MTKRTLTLGNLITEFERYDKRLLVFLDSNEYTNDIDSWRGIYSELAINHTKSDGLAINVGDFLEMLYGCVDKTFSGYKGGYYTMDHLTDVFVDNYGEYSCRVITGVKLSDDEQQVIITTKYEDD